MVNLSAMQSQTLFVLLNQDCVSGMRRFGNGDVDLIVTSPPYNLGIDYGNYNDRKTKEQYLDWTLQWATEAHRLLSDNGSLFLNIGGSPSNPLLPHEVIVKLSSLFVLQNTIHWIKAITVQTPDGKEVSTGHFKPINSKRFVNDCHEYIFHLTKTGDKSIDRLGVGVAYADKSNIKRWSHTNGRDKRCRGNNWYIPYKTIQNRDSERPHPATFPTELATMCIRLHGWRSDLVMMDPFLGIGHSALAAKAAEIQAFIGFDINPDFLNIAKFNLGLNPHQAATQSPPKTIRDRQCQIPSLTLRAILDEYGKSCSA